MRIGAVPIREVRTEGTRLTGTFHLSEDQRAVAAVRRTSLTTVALGTLVEGRGIFRGPIFSRRYVGDPEHGEPYVSAKDLVMADVRPSAYLARSHGGLLEDLRLHEGMILVTCSGMNLGRAIWTRRDLDGLVASHDLIRICPNASVVPPGYLYAFLSGRYGHAFIRKQIYGGNIKHIEPRHIADLPVPRLGDDIERRAHVLVEEAARLRTEAGAQLANTVRGTNETLGLPTGKRESVSSFSVNSVRSSLLNGRLDAPYHCHVAARASTAIAESPIPAEPLSGVLKRYFKPPMFKRLWVDDPTFGRQFISGSDAYRHQAESVRYVSNKTPKFDEFIVAEGTVIFQAAGQIYGLFGQPLFVSGWLSGLFAADDLYRLQPHTVTDGGYLFAFLSTYVGQLLVKRQACGNSIPRVWDPQVRDISIPWPDPEIRMSIGNEVIDAHKKMERARVAEVSAVALVGGTIEEAA